MSVERLVQAAILNRTDTFTVPESKKKSKRMSLASKKERPN